MTTAEKSADEALIDFMVRSEGVLALAQLGIRAQQEGKRVLASKVLTHLTSGGASMSLPSDRDYKCSHTA